MVIKMLKVIYIANNLAHTMKANFNDKKYVSRSP